MDAAATLERTTAPAAKGRSATRVVVAALGTLVGLAGIEHGVGEVLQGPARPQGLMIMSWPDAPSMEILSGEPAMTVIPNLLVTGLLAVLVGAALAAWSIWLPTQRSGGLVLIGLSLLLLLVGGGIAPPLMGFVVGAVATRMDAAPRAPGRVGRVIAPAWPWFLVGALVGYLGLVPGVVLARGVASDGLVIGLAAVAFTGFGLALAAARAQDRLRSAGIGEPTASGR